MGSYQHHQMKFPIPSFGSKGEQHHFSQLNIGWTGLDASDGFCGLLLLLILKKDNFLPIDIFAKKEDTIISKETTNWKNAL